MGNWFSAGDRNPPIAPWVHQPTVQATGVFRSGNNTLHCLVVCSYCKQTHCHALQEDDLTLESRCVGPRIPHCTTLTWQDMDRVREYWIGLHDWWQGGRVVRQEEGEGTVEEGGGPCPPV
jgi:hypothetical protein